MSFIEYLISIGFKPYRRVYDRNSKSWTYKEEEKNLSYFSSSVPGYSDLWLINGKDIIVWGLHEYKHYPTLIYPKLSFTDYEIDRIIQKFSYKDLYKLLINYE